MVRSTKAGVRDGEIKAEDLDINTKCIGTSELEDGSVSYGKLQITSRLGTIGESETEVDMGIGTIDAYWVTPMASVDVWESSVTSGGTVKLKAGAASSEVRIVAIGK